VALTPAPGRRSWTVKSAAALIYAFTFWDSTNGHRLALGALVCIGLLAGLAAAMAAGIFLGVALMRIFEAFGVARSHEVVSPTLHSLDELYRWMLRYGDPVVVMAVSEQVRSSPAESFNWAIDEASRLCKERHAVPTFEFRASRRRPLSDDLAILPIWLFGRGRLRAAAAAVYVSGEAYLVQDALSARQVALLTGPITAVFNSEPATIVEIKEESDHGR
jgi:hypothetical protein